MRWTYWALLAALLVVTGCRERSPSAPPTAQSEGEKPRVFTVNEPLACFARRIGGDLVEVSFPAPDDVDPAYWIPGPETLLKYQSADLILLNGADYAKWTLRSTLPWSRTVMTTRDVEDSHIEIADAVSHTHGPEGEHSHAGLVAETWLDPRIAIAQAQVVLEELQGLLPASSETLTANFGELERDLRGLDTEFESVFQSLPNSWLASHPVYAYLQKRYSLDMRSLHWEPDRHPSDEQWNDLEELLASKPALLMLWENPPRRETAERLAQLGVRVIVFRTAANRSEAGGYFDTMKVNLNHLRAVIDQGDTESG